MRICTYCQESFKDEEIDNSTGLCMQCMGFKIAEENMNLILPILNRFGMSYKKESWGNGEGISLDLGKGILLNFANSGGVYFEFDKDLLEEDNG